jgi:uncharacterized membrane protein YdjX (TVP38/TMEM64 family)
LGPRVLGRVRHQIEALRRARRGDTSREPTRLFGRGGVGAHTLPVAGLKLLPDSSVGDAAGQTGTEVKRKLAMALAVILVVLASGTLLSQHIPDAVSEPLFLLVVILEVVVAPIPGGAIGYLGAARFGFWEAWPLLYLGNVIGTTLVFWLARRYGAPLFEAHVSARARQRYDEQLQQRPFLLWLAYAVPVLPVDVLSILAGLSRVPARRFFLTAYTGYIFYTAIVAYVGASLSHLIGVTNALSVLGGILFVGLLLWAWKGSRDGVRASRQKRSATPTP